MSPTLMLRIQNRLPDRYPDASAEELVECLEIFHNRQRRHSSLGMLTPIEYEIRHQPPARDQAS